MKKRVLCLLLSLCLVFGLLCGLTVTASADTTTYTLQSGDTVVDVCKKLGIDFYANRAWIVQQNNITSFTSLPVGMKLILPASGTTVSTKTTTGSTTVTGASVVTADTVAYYLVNHTMRSGEAVINVCKSLGVDFLTNEKLISAINGINNYKKVQINQVIKIPSYTVPTNGDSYSKVVAHKVVKGDTVGDLCRTYGIDYASYKDAIKGLNGLTKLDVIYEGQTLLLPVSSSLVLGTASSGSAASTDTVVTTPSTSASTDPNAVTYKIYNGKTTAGGTFTARVGTSTVNQAAAGATVKIMVSPNNGYQLANLKVTKHADPDKGKEINVDKINNSFTMPNFDVDVELEFFEIQGSRNLTLKFSGDGKGTAFAMVGDKKVDETGLKSPGYGTTEGTNIKIYADAYKGSEVQDIKVYETGKPLHTLVVTDNSFIMPNFNVTIEVVMKKGDTVEIGTVYDDKMGTLGFEGTYMEGTKIMSASGEKVTVTAAPFSNCSVTEIKVYYAAHTDQIIAKTDKSTLSFEVPSIFDPANNRKVIVEATFALKEPYDIEKAVDPSAGGEFSLQGAFDETASAAKAYEGSNVTIVPKCYAGYTVKEITVTDEGGNLISKGQTSFAMPKCKVKVKVDFQQADKTVLVNKPSAGGSVSAKIDGIAVANVQNLRSGTAGAAPSFVTLKDKTVEIVATPDEGWVLQSIKVTKTGTASVVKDDKNASFKMPDYNVTVDVTFAEVHANKVTLEVSAGGEASLVVDGASALAGVSDTTKNVDKVYVGKEVKLSTQAYDDYRLKSVKIAKDGGDSLTTNNSFNMPDFDVKIEVEFEEVKKSNVSLEVEGGKGGVMTMSVDEALRATVTTTGSVAGVAEGSIVKIAMTKNSGFQDPIVTVSRADGQAVSYTNKDNTIEFVMPGYAVSVKANFEEDPQHQAFAVKKVVSDPRDHDYTVTVNGITTERDSLPLENVTPGTTVTVGPKNYDPKTQNIRVSVFKEGEPATYLSVNSKFEFTMPKYNVQILVEMEDKVSSTIEVKVVGPDAGFGATVKSMSINGTASSEIVDLKVGDDVTTTQKVMTDAKITFSAVRGETSKEATYAIAPKSPDVGKTVSINKDTGEFTMPNFDVVVTVTFEKEPKQFKYSINPFSGTDQYSFDVSTFSPSTGENKDHVDSTSSSTIPYDATITIYPLTEGATVEVWNEAGTTKLSTGASFKMPAENVKIKIIT